MSRAGKAADMGAGQLTFDLPVPSDLTGLPPLLDSLCELLKEDGYPERDIFALKLAVEEVLVAAIRHGNSSAPDKRIHLSYTKTAERFDVRVTNPDEDAGDNPNDWL